ncbi:hypothetical protein H7849_03635 [Alloacidobacterium dinghuense]|uniref:VCBS repeat-containing protein n=1 Tax=Alloacidobacterium dinghuense TaxID=2763107 RepID=A0A7G8BKL1_9BACT|nr:hypothetical protein [Alloacidobacterium dinghuense]QNI33081.1 hypothetical protein H7849_03635 [Alloacidobacterium dinghuense]
MSSFLISILGDRRKLVHLHWLVFKLFWIIFSTAAIAQADNSKLCTRIRLTGSVTVRGYVFRTYEATNPDDDPACLRIYRNGNVVYRMADAAEQYYLGQPGNTQFKIPRISNGEDLTGDGRPDMIVTSWSGGAHCCFNHYIFELEPKLRLLATIKDGDSDLAHFEKLNSDHGYYYITNDIWSYWPASFASSVSHKVILRWDGERFRLDLDKMRYPTPTPQQWKAALKDVDDALKEDGERRGALGVTLWDTVLDFIYTGHSELAWKFVREANPDALTGDNASLEEFCVMLKDSQYWPALEPTLKNMPEECAKAKSKADGKE